MMDWQKIVREAAREAASAKWRDYALTRLPEVPGWNLSKPKGFGGGTDAVYVGQTKGGIPLKVTVDKSKGVFRAEAGGLAVEDDIADLDAGAVQHALGEAAEAMDQHIQDARRRRKTGARRQLPPAQGRWLATLVPPDGADPCIVGRLTAACPPGALRREEEGDLGQSFRPDGSESFPWSVEARRTAPLSYAKRMFLEALSSA